MHVAAAGRRQVKSTRSRVIAHDTMTENDNQSGGFVGGVIKVGVCRTAVH